MPRFRLTTALILLTAVALWFSTAGLDPSLGRWIRNIYWTLGFATALLCVIRFRGRTQYFWVGLLLALILKGWRKDWALSVYAFNNTAIVDRISGLFFSVHPMPVSDRPAYFAVRDTTDLACTLLVGLIAGRIAQAIYDRANSVGE